MARAREVAGKRLKSLCNQSVQETTNSVMYETHSVSKTGSSVRGTSVRVPLSRIFQSLLEKEIIQIINHPVSLKKAV